MLKPGMSDEVLIGVFVLYMIFTAWCFRNSWLPAWKKWRKKDES